MKKIGLLGRIIIAIALAAALGTFMPVFIVRLFATFNSIFGQFIGFAVPLIIIAFIAPGIAELGKGAGRLLGISTLLAYISTIVAGFLAYFAASTFLPRFFEGTNEKVAEPGEGLVTAFFDFGIEPLMGVMTALVFAFVIGIGMAAIKGDVMQRGFNELKEIVEKIISVVIIPLLPIHIFGIFLNMTYAGEVARILSIFAVVFVLIILLHWLMLSAQYTVAGVMTKRNPLLLLKTMLPAYFTAIGTQSSAAAIPVTLQQAKEAGASDKVAGFTVPLFATIHLSGSMITLVTCSIGVLMMNDLPITLGVYTQFIFMLAVTMIAAPGVPGGAVMAALGVLGSILGFDETILALMMALYLAQDSFGTATNVTGDGALTLIVDRIAKKA
ncbi:sodium:proton antiporter [Lysinibacillus alkalisoli]|uniref:Sodium:proton antiporter n=1 Tax=Lysinibacillus alkalisoli TaxID=1911548 RepID=A0A917G6H2_9BACI|nr:dicarboxylate/amino acid:cation symporter [Lysinibacillus alkalisoli]GGG24269.1 sodium:proton antiporter [Lysinibacillus alkalisoli]